MTLLQISDDVSALEDLLIEAAENGNGDITAVESQISKWFAELGKQQSEKVDNYCALIRDLELRAAARKEESERLSKRAKIDQAQAEFLIQRLKLHFQQHNLKKIQTTRFMVSLVNNGGAVPLILDDEPERFPSEFKTITAVVKPNSDAIRAKLESGEKLPFAHLGTRGQRISIR